MGYSFSAEVAPYLSEGEIAMFEEQFNALLPTLLRALLGFGIVAGVLFLVFYVFFSISIYTMSDRRGLSGSFLAWIPFLRQIQMGRVASDAHAQRTGKSAFYGVAIALMMFLPALVFVAAFFTQVPWWVSSISGLVCAALSVVYIFAHAEIFRDYSSHWVGMLIFSILCPFLVPIFLLVMHKHIPFSAKHAPAPGPKVYSAPYTPPAAPAQPQKPVEVPHVEAEPIVTPPPAPAEPVHAQPAPVEDVVDAAVAETAAAIEDAAEEAAEEVVGEL